jgi:hypothetical protein
MRGRSSDVNIHTVHPASFNLSTHSLPPGRISHSWYSLTGNLQSSSLAMLRGSGTPAGCNTQKKMASETFAKEAYKPDKEK